MLMKESSSADLSTSLSTWRQVHGAVLQCIRVGICPLVITLTTGQRYLCSWMGSPTAPMPHLLTTSFWCYGKRENHLFSPLGPEEDPLLRPCKGNELFSINFFEIQDQSLGAGSGSFEHLCCHYSSIAALHLCTSVDYGLNFVKSRHTL